MNPKVLVIEDDPDINELLALNLGDLNFDVLSCEDGTSGYEAARGKSFDLVVLDLMLPGINGLDICRKLRAEKIFTPILMLTSLDSETDRVVGLEVGADDYLVKPFSIREFQARAKALLRRVEQFSVNKENSTEEATLTAAGLEIDFVRRIVTCADKQVTLTNTEFDLLAHLAKNPGRVFSRADLLDKIWGYHHAGYEHTVNSHINRLRSKIELDPGNPEFVLTVWGVGYKFQDREDHV